MATPQEVYRQIQERAQQFVNAGACKTLAQGIDLVLQQNPQLYEAYRSAAATPTVSAPSNPVHTVKALADGLIQKGAASDPQSAIIAVFKQHPELYEEYRREVPCVGATLGKATPRRESAAKAFVAGAQSIQKADEPLADAQQRFVKTAAGKYYYATASGRDPGPDPAEQAAIALASRVLKVVEAMKNEVEAIAKENGFTLRKVVPIRKYNHAATFNEILADMRSDLPPAA